MKLGTSNACTDCHRDKPAQWAADAVETWFGPRRKGFQTWGAAFDAAWRGEADATEQLTAVVSGEQTPAYVRAAALSELGAAGTVLARAALADPDPVVRIGALDALDALPDAERWPPRPARAAGRRPRPPRRGAAARCRNTAAVSTV